MGKTEFNRDAEYFSLIGQGVCLFGNKEYALALTEFWKAFRLRPAAPVALYNLARTMEELNDPRAEDFYAAAATQGNADALYQLALFCLRCGRTDEAISHVKGFLKQHRGCEDEYTEWARGVIHKLCPSPVLVWRDGKRLYAD